MIGNEQLFEKCGIAAQVVLKYGSIHRLDINEEHFIEFSGNYDDTRYTYSKIRNSHIKWYLRNHFKTNDPIWNGDFIAGISKVGKICWSRTQFPSLRWWGAPNLAEALEVCPFYGPVKNGELQKKEKKRYCWKRAPALYLGSNHDTVSYIAGLLATGRRYKYKDHTYALYKNEVADELAKFNIRIERYTSRRKRPLLSPFWPALFTKFMPEPCHDYWLNVKKPYKGEEYAAILWATHANHNFVRKGLPFLPSRRSVFYKFKSEEGTIKELQKSRIRNGLVSLDNLVKDCIVEWFQNI